MDQSKFRDEGVNVSGTNVGDVSDSIYMCRSCDVSDCVWSHDGGVSLPGSSVEDSLGIWSCNDGPSFGVVAPVLGM